MFDEIVYICDRCGEKFSLDEAGKIYCDGQPETVCPNCKSADIEEGRRCKVYRDIHYPHKLKGDVCIYCFADAVSAYKHYLEYLQPWEREALDDEYGNIDVTERD